MNESILDSVKLYLGINPDNESFDNQLIIAINAALASVRQMGIGNEYGYSIKSEENIWKELISEETRLEPVKAYVCLKVKLLFDPPVSSIVKEATEKVLQELEWRLGMTTDVEINTE